MSGLRKAHHRGTFAARGRLVRAMAQADSTTRCWRCGALADPGDPWQAGHVRDGDPSSPLAAEHRSCNARAGRRSQDGDGLEVSRRRWY
jgi:hypothetical protein